jgi:uncharacterized protein
MKLPISLSVLCKTVLIASGLSIGVVMNYNEFFADPPRTPPAAVEQVVARPSDSRHPPIVRSPDQRLEDSAEAGNLKDQLTLAVKYATADGAARNQAEASRWYLRAAQGGNAQAMYEISMRYRHAHGLTKNDTEANIWRQRAASSGHAEAAYEMAHVFGTVTSKGAVLAQDKETEPGDRSRQLVMWLTQASELGSAAAKHELALVRLFGISKDRSDKSNYLIPLPSVTASALQLLTENAESGYWHSQYVLAELYQAGYADIKPSQADANKWWERLDRQTDPSVQLSIGERYLIRDVEKYRVGDNKWKGRSLSYEDSNRVAFEWFARAAGQADNNALWQVATMTYNGIGTAKDPASALELHQKAADLGQVEAMYYLGVALAKGTGVQDDAAALRWLARSVAHEDAYGSNPIRSRAQNAIGLAYEKGRGTESDLVLAYAWYSLAYTGGLQDASENLRRVAQLLQPDQMLEAQALSREWKPGNQVIRRPR